MASTVRYIAPPGLEKAREVAEFLNRPLLLAGEPGTGKTTFAEHLAFGDNRNKDLFIFNTKSISQAQDLFYSYDAIAHFAEKEKSAIEFITLEAMGKAVVNALGFDLVKKKLLSEPSANNQIIKLRQSEYAEEIVNRFLTGCQGKSSVVLIDEIDKAPRDFPNDLLNEIEKLEFRIRELDVHFTLNKSEKATKDKIFVLLTSNSDKMLPDAFLRRCLFYFIEFPGEEEINKIISSHLPDIDSTMKSERVKELIEFRRKEGLSKKPATSEFIDCLKWLNHENKIHERIVSNPAALYTLFKKTDDLKLFIK